MTPGTSSVPAATRARLAASVEPDDVEPALPLDVRHTLRDCAARIDELEFERARELHPDLEELVATLSARRDEAALDGQAISANLWKAAAETIHALAKRNAELSLRNDERATGWFVVDPDEGVCGAYETREGAEAARVAMHEPDELEEAQTYVAEVDYVGPLRKRVGELEEGLRGIARSWTNVAGLPKRVAKILSTAVAVLFVFLVGAPLEAEAGDRWERRRAKRVERMCERRLPSLATFCGVDLEAPPTVEEACSVLPLLGCDLVDEWEDRTGELWPCSCVEDGLIGLPPAPPAPGPVPSP